MRRGFPVLLLVKGVQIFVLLLVSGSVRLTHVAPQKMGRREIGKKLCIYVYPVSRPEDSRFQSVAAHRPVDDHGGRRVFTSRSRKTYSRSLHQRADALINLPSVKYDVCFSPSSNYIEVITRST